MTGPSGYLETTRSPSTQQLKETLIITQNRGLIASSGGKLFSKVDLASAYQQILLDELSKKYTIINTPKVVLLRTTDHKISGRGLQPTNEKIQAIKNAPAPQDVTQLKSFLGLLNYYYSKFLPNLSNNLLPPTTGYCRITKDSVGSPSK